MKHWANFAAAAPELAAFGAQRLHGSVAYLATIRPDGAPRVHPVTPIIGEGHLFVFMEPTSPKGKDLQRDNRYALHCA
ncbi:MAG: pyridoxamine 5'-phosphate oxidase family protein, partial [Chloroflexi bacterium]|nr:pyridoxamine 5'-phosphate oxidase family protein [Chloroflexota bacterium]